MAVFTMRTTTKTWREFVLPNPTNWAEVNKAIAATRQALVTAGRDPQWDDVVEVAATDEEIVFRFEVRSGGAA